MNDKKEEELDIVTFLVSVLLAGVIIVVMFLIMDVLWPMLRFLAKEAWKKTSHQLSNSKQVLPVQKLPTPDIFKGAPNLGLARDFTWKK